MSQPPARPSSDSLHAGFLQILPRIERHGRVYFRHLKCAHRKADAVAEMVALAWQWYLRLVSRGKDPSQFAAAIATFAARQVRCGRRLGGREKSNDVLSPVGAAAAGLQGRVVVRAESAPGHHTGSCSRPGLLPPGLSLLAPHPSRARSPTDRGPDARREHVKHGPEVRPQPRPGQPVASASSWRTGDASPGRTGSKRSGTSTLTAITRPHSPNEKR